MIRAAVLFSRGIRYVSIFVVGLLVVLIAVTVPDRLFISNILAVHTAGAAIEELRGLSSVQASDRFQVEQVENIAHLQSEVADLSRRMDAFENQHYDARVALLDARLETIFELGRIVLGAAVLYLMQVLAQIITWAIGKSKPSVKAAG